MRTPLLALSALLLSSCVAAVDTLVRLDYAAYNGTALPNGVSQWLGIRYAASPVGQLRFAAPQDPEVQSEVVGATKHGKLCLATSASPTDKTTSEDCLFLDVYAPTNATNSSNLPVYLFIQGGGFASNANANLNGSALIRAADMDLVVVTFNYRVGPYGFPPSNDSTVTPNAGLWDQRKAMQWVHTHISQFGGNASHVTLGGASAGGASVLFHLTSPLNNHSTANYSLFHALTLESPSFGPVLNLSQASYQYSHLLSATGCSDLPCLRNLPASTLQKSNKPIPYPGLTQTPIYMWSPVIDNGSFVAQHPLAALTTGAFVPNLPVLLGDDANGGTVFAPRNTRSRPAGQTFLQANFPALGTSELQRIDSLWEPTHYTDADGIWGGTTVGLGAWFEWTAKVYGDLRYGCPELITGTALAGSGTNAKVWNYLYNVSTPATTRSGLGVRHLAELPALWSSGASASPLRPYWISFLRAGDVNRYPSDDAEEWLVWPTGGDSSLKHGRRMVFNASAVAMRDVSRDRLVAERCEWVAGRTDLRTLPAGGAEAGAVTSGAVGGRRRGWWGEGGLVIVVGVAVGVIGW